MRCRTAQRVLTAAADGELRPRRRRTLDRHLERCAACRAEAERTNQLLAALDGLAFERDVPARVERDLLRRVRILAADDQARHELRAPRWTPALVPALATAGVVILAVLVARSPSTRAPMLVTSKAPDAARHAENAAPSRVATREQPPPSDPPPALAERPDLFMDLAILRNLEKLENYDAIATMNGDDGSGPNG